MPDTEGKRRGCIASPDGRHRRDDTLWWCAWCSDELGLPKYRLPRSPAAPTRVISSGKSRGTS